MRVPVPRVAPAGGTGNLTAPPPSDFLSAPPPRCHPSWAVSPAPARRVAAGHLCREARTKRVVEALFSIDSRAFGALAVGSEAPSGRLVTSSGGYAPLGLGPTRRQPVAGLATRDPVELEVPLGRAGAAVGWRWPCTVRPGPAPRRAGACLAV